MCAPSTPSPLLVATLVGYEFYEFNEGLELNKSLVHERLTQNTSHLKLKKVTPQPICEKIALVICTDRPIWLQVSADKGTWWWMEMLLRETETRHA